MLIQLRRWSKYVESRPAGLWLVLVGHDNEEGDGMHAWRAVTGLFGALALAAIGVVWVPAPPASAAGPARPTAHRLLTAAEASAIHTADAGPPVTIGVDNAPPPDKASKWEYVHYFPESNVDVPQGGVVLFNWNTASQNGLHSVTLVPNGMSAAQVRAAYPVATSDSDSGEHDVVQPASSNNPTSFACSTPDHQVPCAFDGQSVLSSGVAPATSGAVFAVQLAPTIAPGTYTYVCLIHHNMSGTINVVPAGTPATDPATVAARAHAEYVQLTGEAYQAEAAAQRPVGTTNPDGSHTWTVHAGVTADDVELLEFLPQSLPIRAGDRVHYQVDSQNEIHTVTFPLSDAAFSAVPFGAGQCERADGSDTDAAPANGPPELGCPDPSSFEQPYILPGQGEQQRIASENTLGSSGLLSTVPEFTANGAAASHDYSFPANGTYYYQCLVHPGMAAVVTTQGYRVTTASGGVFTFGNTDFAGSKGGGPSTSPVVATVATNDRQGYWLVTADGHTFNFGSAPKVGDLATAPQKPIVAAVATADDGGLYLASSDGGVFSLGDAEFLGSLGATHLNAPIVAITADRFFSGGGYTLIAADGGTFAFNTGFLGSLAGTHLVAPIVAAFGAVDGSGITMVAADGGVFILGNGQFFGSLGGQPLNAPIVGVAPTADTFTGYRLLARDGGVFAFGPGAPFLGSLPSVGGAGPAVGITGA